MKIGVDLDDTICRTSEMVHLCVEEYAEKIKITPLDIMNDEDLKTEFFQKYLSYIYENAEIKREVYHVLKRLRSKGNQIIIITSRNNSLVPTIDVLEITKKWLEKENIVVDNIITSVYGDKKAQACKENGIDLMIDDDPYNYKKITSMGIRCILFDDRGKYCLKDDYASTWKEIEEYIERNR